jgi:hypothetical protein
MTAGMVDTVWLLYFHFQSPSRYTAARRGLPNSDWFAVAKMLDFNSSDSRSLDPRRPFFSGKRMKMPSMENSP